MNTKALYSILAVLVILIAAGYVFMQSGKETSPQAEKQSQGQSSEPVTDDKQATMDDKSLDNNQENKTEGTYSGESDVANVDVAVFDVTFDGTAFSPSKLQIKNGDIVRFKNNSDKDFWPASSPHPAHTDYPEFDPKKKLGPNSVWEFKFTQTGVWKFHDHLTPSAYGSITVE